MVALLLVWGPALFAQSPATMWSPAQGSTLPGSSVTFQWSTGTGVTQYWLSISKVGVGGGDLFNSDPGPGLVTSRTIIGLPIDGSTIYVRLYSYTGNWASLDYTYTAATAGPAIITSPANGSTLPGSSVTFQWTTGIGVSQYWLSISKVGAGGGDLYNADPGPGPVTSKTINGLPTDGSTVYVSLYSCIGSNWNSLAYTYTAAGPANVTSPANGSTFTSSSVTFQWSAGGGVTQYWLSISKVGAGGGDLYNSDPGPGLVTSKTITGLPTDGSTIYVRLYSHIGGTWPSRDYTYTAVGGAFATVAAPTFNPGTGTYTSAQTVTISTTTTGASIRYTTDNSPPSSTAGTLYSGPITVGSTLTVKAIAYKTGMTDSYVTSATYTLNTCSPCIQGSKTDALGAPFTNPGATIAIDGTPFSGAGSSSYRVTVSAGNHTVTSSVPTGYYAFYSLCTNCMDHTAAGGHPFHLGASVTFNVPVGNFVDVRWKYMQPQPVPQSFRDCVNPTNPIALDSAPAVICTLPIGPWSVPAAAPIIVGRSNVTVQGGSTDMNGCDTILIRDYPDPLHPMEMMVVDRFSAPLKGITIQHLHFEGNLSLVPSALRARDIVDKACNSHQGEGIIVPPLCGGCSDLAIKNVTSSAAYIPDPFNPPTGYSYGVTINNCAFENAPGHAITIFPTKIGTINQQANDIYIHDNDISTAATTGILGGVNDVLNYEDKANCDDPDSQHPRNPAFMDDPGVSVPRNVRIEHNTFYNNNGAAVAGLARWVGIRNNTFRQNYLILQNDITPGGVDLAGGSIYMGQCADKAQIYHNTLQGPATWPKTGGLELWGRNLDVGSSLDVTQSNEITGYPNEGIAANSLLNGTIANNYIHDNNTSFVAGNPTLHTGGIAVWTQGTDAACAPVRRDTTNLTVTGDISTGASQAYGIHLGHVNHSTNTVNINTVGGNVLSPIAISGFCFDPNVTYTSLSLDPVPIKCPDQPLPAPPDAVSISPVCPTGPTVPSQTFTFIVNEDTGASNVWVVQPFFSIVPYTADPSVKPGNGSGGCKILFYASNGDSTNPQAANALYLDGPDSWVAPLAVPVGYDPNGGGDVSNSTCIVHAGSPNSKVERSGDKLTLTLEIQFLKAVSNQTFFGYLSAENNQRVKTKDPEWAELGTWTVPIIP